LGFISETYGIKIMNDRTILLQLKGIMQNIDQSLYNLAFDINKITRKILEEDEKTEKDKD
jgi:hypothetical protein